MGTYIQVFKPFFNETILQPKNSILEEKDSLTRYQVSTNISIHQKIVIFVGKYIRGAEYKSGRTSFFGNRADNINEKAEALVIEEYDRGHFFVGESLLFFCVGVEHFFARGAWLSVTWNNGSHTALLRLNRNDPLYRLDKDVEMANNTVMFHEIVPETHVFAEAVEASVSMDRVNCWMPEAESENWYRISKKISVFPSIAPRFLENKDEHLYLQLGEENRTITCTIAEAKPFPQLQVLWDGKPVALSLDAEKLKQLAIKADSEVYTDKENMTKPNNLLNFTLHYSKTEHGDMSIIQCIASNVNSTVTRTVRVSVLARNRTGLMISLSVSGLLILILAALALKYWRDKRTSASRSTPS